MKASLLWPNHLPKALPPNAITLGIRFQHLHFRRHKHSSHGLLFSIPLSWNTLSLDIPQLIPLLHLGVYSVSPTQNDPWTLKTSTLVTLNHLILPISLPNTYHYVIVFYWFVWLFMVCDSNQNVNSINISILTVFVFFTPLWLSGKESTASEGDTSLIPGLGRSPGGGNGNSLQYSSLENSMDRGAWQAIVYRVTKESDTV